MELAKTTFVALWCFTLFMGNRQKKYIYICVYSLSFYKGGEKDLEREAPSYSGDHSNCSECDGEDCFDLGANYQVSHVELDFPQNCRDFQRFMFLNCPDTILQTWTYIVKFGEMLSLFSVWDQLLLPFISYGMKSEADWGSFLWCYTVPRILCGILCKHYFLIFLASHLMIEKKRSK